LDGIGKTGARASFKFAGNGMSLAAKEVAGMPGIHAVMLQTPALLLDAVDLVDDAGQWRTDALSAYRAYWATILPGAELLDHAASQRLTGGYLSKRRRAYGKDGYHPFLLTDAGSVFLLKTASKEKLTALLRTGLPLPARSGGSVCARERLRRDHCRLSERPCDHRQARGSCP
jgi:hypothetical protein